MQKFKKAVSLLLAAAMLIGSVYAEPTQTTTSGGIELTQAATYEVRFVGMNLTTVISSQMVEEGQDAVPPAFPASDIYNYTGWLGTWTNITKTTLVRIEGTPKVYTVTYLDHDGSVIRTNNSFHWQAPGFNFRMPPQVPSPTLQDGRVFSGWDNTAINLTGNMTITAQYAVPYTVRWLAPDGGLIKTDAVAPGRNAIAPQPQEMPVIPGKAFASMWTSSVPSLNQWSMITENVDFTAVYSDAHTVRYLNHEGNAVSTQYLANGAMYTQNPPVLPARLGYRFTGWSESILWQPIFGPKDITPVYSGPHPIHTITYTDKAGNIVGTSQITDGDVITSGMPMASVLLPVPFLEFGGWDYNWQPVTSDLTVTARYNPTSGVIDGITYQPIITASPPQWLPIVNGYRITASTPAAPAALLEIPAEVQGKPVVEIRPNTLAMRRYDRITVPSSVTTLWSSAFNAGLVDLRAINSIIFDVMQTDAIYLVGANKTVTSPLLPNIASAYNTFGKKAGHFAFSPQANAWQYRPVSTIITGDIASGGSIDGTVFLSDFYESDLNASVSVMGQQVTMIIPSDGVFTKIEFTPGLADITVNNEPKTMSQPLTAVTNPTTGHTNYKVLLSDVIKYIPGVYLHENSDNLGNITLDVNSTPGGLSKDIVPALPETETKQLHENPVNDPFKQDIMYHVGATATNEVVSVLKGKVTINGKTPRLRTGITYENGAMGHPDQRRPIETFILIEDPDSPEMSLTNGYIDSIQDVLTVDDNTAQADLTRPAKVLVSSPTTRDTDITLKINGVKRGVEYRLYDLIAAGKVDVSGRTIEPLHGGYVLRGTGGDLSVADQSKDPRISYWVSDVRIHHTEDYANGVTEASRPHIELSPMSELIGRVTTSTGNPVQGVTVTVQANTIDDQILTTDADGIYRLLIPRVSGPDGLNQVRIYAHKGPDVASATNAASKTITVTSLRYSELIYGNLRLNGNLSFAAPPAPPAPPAPTPEPEPTGTIYGKVTNVDDTPIDGATVMVFSPGGTKFRATQTAEDGSYRFKELPLGKYIMLSITTEGYQLSVINN